MDFLKNIYNNGHNYSYILDDFALPLYGTAFYLLFLGLGSRLMKNRKPFDVLMIQRIHNFLLFIASFVMAVGITYEAYKSKINTNKI